MKAGMKRLVVATSVLTWLATAGCYRATEPEVDLAPVQVAALGLELQPSGQGLAEVTFQLAAPEAKAGSVTFAECELFLDGRYVAAAAFSLAEPLPKEGRQLRVSFPVVFRGALQPELATVRAGVRGKLTLRHEGSEARYSFAGKSQLTSRFIPLPDPGIQLE